MILNEKKNLGSHSRTWCSVGSILHTDYLESKWPIIWVTFNKFWAALGYSGLVFCYVAYQVEADWLAISVSPLRATGSSEVTQGARSQSAGDDGDEANMAREALPRSPKDQINRIRI